MRGISRCEIVYVRHRMNSWPHKEPLCIADIRREPDQYIHYPPEVRRGKYIGVVSIPDAILPSFQYWIMIAQI